MFQAKVVEKIKTHILCSVTSKFFFRKSCRLLDNMEKLCTTGQATEKDMAHAPCMLDTQGYKHAEGVQYSLFSTATMVARMRLHVTLYVHCLYC
jgi:hypothetical protein